MGAKITKSEQAAIAAYRGKITVCPPGNAIGSDMGWNGEAQVIQLDAWLAERGLSAVPIREAPSLYGNPISVSVNGKFAGPKFHHKKAA